MNRSSPVTVYPASARGLPAFIASAARYRPAGQPSVRWTRSSTSCASSSTPAPPSSMAASRSDMARSSAPISTMRPCARSRAAGNEQRVPGCDGQPRSGRKDSASSAIASRHSGFVIASASSSTSATGSRIDADRGHQQRDDGDRALPAAASARKTAGVDRLDPVQGRREVGEQHRRIVVAVVGRDPRDPRLPLSAHCASSVVFP